MILSTDERIFRMNDAHRAQLMDCLNNPTLSLAFSILTAVPSKEPAFMAGVPFDTTLAHEYCKAIGANSVLKGLVRMTHPPKQSPEEKEDSGEEQDWKWLEDSVQIPQPKVPKVDETPSKPKKRKSN